MKLIFLWIIDLSLELSHNKKWLKSSKHQCHLLNTPCFDGTVIDHIIAIEHQSVYLHCYIYNANFSNVIIAWWKEGGIRELTLGDTSNDNRFQIIHSFYQDWTLEIKNLKFTDSGIYICQINLIELLEKYFKLEVIEMSSSKKPISDINFIKDEAVETITKKFVTIHGNSIGIVGQPLSLSCAASFTDVVVDANIQWFHNEKLQHTSNNEDIELSYRWDKNNTAHSVLTINKLLLSHAGIWKCSKITDILIEPHESAEIEVIVKEMNSNNGHRKIDNAKLTKSNSNLYRMTKCFLSVSRCFIIYVLIFIYF